MTRQSRPAPIFATTSLIENQEKFLVNKKEKEKILKITHTEHKIIIHVRRICPERSFRVRFLRFYLKRYISFTLPRCSIEITLHHCAILELGYPLFFVAVSIVKFAFRLVPSNHRQSEKPSCVFVNCILENVARASSIRGLRVVHANWTKLIRRRLARSKENEGDPNEALATSSRNVHWTRIVETRKYYISTIRRNISKLNWKFGYAIKTLEFTFC